jgi:hypothetical protein
MTQLIKERTQYIADLLEAASIVDVAIRTTDGEGKIINNNVMAHIMARVYLNGYMFNGND